MMLTQHIERVMATQALVTLMATRDCVSLSCDLCFAVNPTSMPWLTLAHLAKSLLLRGLLTFELSVGQL